MHVLTFYREEEEVRAVDTVDDEGDVYRMGIWIAVDNSIKVGVGYKHYKNKKKSKDYKVFTATLSNLEENLESAYSELMLWINQSGNKRTPVL